MTRIPCPIRLHAQQGLPSPAIQLDDGALSYQQLDRRLNALQQQLADAGLLRGSCLMAQEANSLELLLLAWACLRSGILFCPLNPTLPLARVRELSARLDANACWLPKWPAEQGEPPCRRLNLDFTAQLAGQSELGLESEGLNNLLLTSGSSGEPKIVAHRLNAHLASAIGSQQAIPLQPGDGWLLSLPLFHVGGYAIPMRCFLAGATLILPEQPTPLAQRLREQNITHLSLVPTQLYRLLQTPGFTLQQTRLRHLLLGGAPIPQPLLHRCQAQGLHPQVSYGLSEMASQVNTGYVSPIAGAVGFPLPGREVMLKEGEICVRGRTLFAGYYQAGQLSLPLDDEGWFHTGDLGHFTPDGELVVSGRRGNRFICGGENIQPEEIEAQLLNHDAVRQALVVGVADPEWGQRAVAFVELELELPYQALILWLRNTLPAHLIPKQWLAWPRDLESGLKPSRQLFQRLAQQAQAAPAEGR